MPPPNMSPNLNFNADSNSGSNSNSDSASASCSGSGCVFTTVLFVAGSARERVSRWFFGPCDFSAEKSQGPKNQRLTRSRALPATNNTVVKTQPEPEHEADAESEFEFEPEFESALKFRLGLMFGGGMFAAP